MWFTKDVFIVPNCLDMFVMGILGLENGLILSPDHIKMIWDGQYSLHITDLDREKNPFRHQSDINFQFL